ncbi:hypothetical protein F0562_024052 [Nyssa sinensis]|uniref:Uncharacterized protein n=1 Tax=Nyssa sinensis TaxID=561372 RepID=A0A5J5BID0_9ASTE|nr:hypothetical protein F0562_024052 [Nyssa sinensis]
MDWLKEGCVVRAREAMCDELYSMAVAIRKRLLVSLNQSFPRTGNRKVRNRLEVESRKTIKPTIPTGLQLQTDYLCWIRTC